MVAAVNMYYTDILCYVVLCRLNAENYYSRKFNEAHLCNHLVSQPTLTL